MSWVYEQSTGKLFLNTIFVGSGYSGNGAGLNNPAMQDAHNVGPIPRGAYTIGPAHMPQDHLGPLAMPLYPALDNAMFGRFGFFMHGDNQFMDHTASDGCIVLDFAIRQQVSLSGDIALSVVA